MLLGAVILLILGAVALAASGLISSYLTESDLLEQYFMAPGFEVTPSFIGGMITIVGGFFIVIGLVSLLLAYGLLKGAEWARLLVIVLAAIGVLLSLLSLASGSVLSVVGLLIDGAIVYYLTRAHVVEYFRAPK
jgi:uncharacterized membrane protein (DUF2068 family)